MYRKVSRKKSLTQSKPHPQTKLWLSQTCTLYCSSVIIHHHLVVYQSEYSR